VHWTKDTVEYITCRKVESILAAAAAGQCTTLVLAAIGCGVFARNPRLIGMLGDDASASGTRQETSIAMAKIVASCFARVLKAPPFTRRFDRVVFAIAYNERMLEAFQDAFEEHYYDGTRT